MRNSQSTLKFWIYYHKLSSTELKNSCLWSLAPDNRFLLAVMFSPAFEKSLSEGTEVAIMVMYFKAMEVSVGYECLLSIHHLIGSISSGTTGVRRNKLSSGGNSSTVISSFLRWSFSANLWCLAHNDNSGLFFFPVIKILSYYRVAKALTPFLV